MTVYTKQIGTAGIGLFYQQISASRFSAILYGRNVVFGPGATSGDGALIDSTVFTGETLVFSEPLIVDLADLSARSDWDDFACFAFPYVAAVGGGLAFKAPFNLHPETFVAKNQYRFNAQRNKENYALLLFVPHKGVTTLAQCGITIYSHTGGEFPPIFDRWPTFDPITNQLTGLTVIANPVQPVVADPASTLATQAATYLKAKITGPATLAANTYGTYAVTLFEPDGATPATLSGMELRLESTGGYLPLQRVTTTNGVAQFSLGALGLASGQSFRVKAGTRTYTGVADFTVTVP